MFLGLNWLKHHDLGSKRRILGVQQNRKRPKDPWLNCCRVTDRADWRVVFRLMVRTGRPSFATEDWKLTGLSTKLIDGPSVNWRFVLVDRHWRLKTESWLAHRWSWLTVCSWLLSVAPTTSENLEFFSLLESVVLQPMHTFFADIPSYFLLKHY